MAYKFRVCFQFSDDGTFTGKEEVVEFQTNISGENLKLAALGKDKKFDSSNRFHVVGGSYETIEEAQTFAEKVRVAILYYATKQRVGIDLGKYELSGGLTDVGRKIFSERLGSPVLSDRNGISIFEAEPAPIFSRFEFKAKLGKSTADFVDTIKQGYGHYAINSPRAELAIELYSMSHFESTGGARFLALYMCLEALLEPLPRSENARLHVDKLIQATKNAEISNNEKESIIGSLAWLKNHSIAQAGRKMASELLADREYFSMPAEKFFQKICKTRNDFVHRGITNRQELHGLVAGADQFVSDILQAQFILKK